MTHRLACGTRRSARSHRACRRDRPARVRRGALQFSIAVAGSCWPSPSAAGRVFAVMHQRSFERAAVLLAAARVRALTLVSAAALDRQRARASSTEAARAVSDRARWSTSSAAARGPDGAAPSSSLSRGERGVRHRPVRASCNYDNLGQRPQGTLGHYMTYSGLLMLVIGGRRRAPALRAARTDVAGAGHAGARSSRSC